MISILDVLDLVGPGLPERWVSAAAFRRVRAAAARLPEGSPVCFLERGFAEQGKRLDFGLCYPYPAFRSLLNDSKRLASQVPFIWIEVDHSRIPKRSPPGVLLCVDRKLGRQAFARRVPELTERRLLSLGDAAHRHFLLDALPHAVRGSLRSCFAALPSSGRILHLCFMPSRSPAVMKVNVSLPRRALLTYLERVGWPGSFSELERVWSRIGPMLDTAKIDLTLSPGMRPKLGLEIHPFNTSFEGRRDVLAWLQREGKAERQQRADLLAWHGEKQLRSLAGTASVELDFGMKLVLDEGAPLEAKAYFQMTSDKLLRPVRVANARRELHV